MPRSDSPSSTPVSAPVAASAPVALDDGSGRRLARSITATWWYTASAIVIFDLVVAPLALVAALQAGNPPQLSFAIAIGVLLWWAARMPLLAQYRHRTEGGPIAAGWQPWVALGAGVTFAVLAGPIGGMWTLALLGIVQPAMLLHWPRGVRLRIVIGVTIALVALWIIESRTIVGLLETANQRSNHWLFGVVVILLPAMSVLSLWWWDVLVALDRARAAEARLAATQERLRVATDVHDLQGHHLQVIALQLELAERLMTKDADGALEQLRLARASVDEARQGTRDLATRFRGVPLPDEIANAVDLLHAAGIRAEATLSPDAAHAPAETLGPVIRETATNVLRHGGGSWARLALTRDRAVWRYEIANDAGDAPVSADGSGLRGIAHRVEEAGGTVEIRRGDEVRRGEEFRVVVTVPAASASADDAGTGDGSR